MRRRQSGRVCSQAIRDADMVPTTASSAPAAKSVRSADNNYHRILQSAVVAGGGIEWVV